MGHFSAAVGMVVIIENLNSRLKELRDLKNGDVVGEQFVRWFAYNA